MAIIKVVRQENLGLTLKQDVGTSKLEVNIDGTTLIKSGLGVISTALDPQVVTDLVTLSGVATNAQNLGTFTGTTIADNSTIKAAIQALETAHEALNISGQYAGSAATFAALPTTTADGKAVNNGDWAILSTDDGANQAGVYMFNGTIYALAKEIPEVFTLSVTSSDSTSIDFSGVGTVGSPLTASVIVDPLVGNLFKVTATGTRVAPADVKAALTFDNELQDIFSVNLGYFNSTTNFA